jgi:hypothetical protein
VAWLGRTMCQADDIKQKRNGMKVALVFLSTTELIISRKSMTRRSLKFMRVPVSYKLQFFSDEMKL